MKIVHTSTIKHDDYTRFVCQSYDIKEADEQTTEINANIHGVFARDWDWQIGVVYGGSGSGKTSILREFFAHDVSEPLFDNDKALISNFNFVTPKEATEILTAIGLSSIPVWLRPYHVLSNGEQYRAKVAYMVASGDDLITIDEFTSVVDRDVAKAMSNSLQSYVRRSGKRVVIATCHFDIMQYLQPDWIYSPAKRRLEKAPRLRRESLELKIFRARIQAWELFRKHHYLTEEINDSSRCYIAELNERAIAFVSVLPLPSGTLQNAYKIHRLVVLPDFQGLGIGTELLTKISSLYLATGKRMYIKTSNISLHKSLSRHLEWELCKQQTDIEKVKAYNERNKQNPGVKGSLRFHKESLTKTFRFRGLPDTDNNNIVLFDQNAYIDVAVNQISLF